MPKKIKYFGTKIEIKHVDLLELKTCFLCSFWLVTFDNIALSDWFLLTNSQNDSRVSEKSGR